MKIIVDMGDVDVIVDLRHLNSGRKCMYEVFWQECSKFIQESIGQAVDDRRHEEVTHFATAISVPDLISQVSKQCPEGTPIPSESWVRLQFWPKNRFIGIPLVTIPASLTSGIWFKLDSLENIMKIAIMLQHFLDINERWLLNLETTVPLSA